MPTKNLFLSFVSIGVLLAATNFATAASSVVGNFSFETPNDTATMPYTTQFPVDGPGVSSTWEQFGNGYKGVYVTSHFGGTLTNAPGSNGVDGPQAGSIASGNGSGLLFQEVSNNYAGTDPLQTFQAGYSYTFTVGVGRRADSLPPLGAQITLTLFSRPADQGGATFLASTPLTVGTTPGLETTVSGVLTDYSVSYTVPIGSASIGKPVGLLFNITTPAGITGGDFALDNVRLTSVQVPEPSTYALLGAGAVGLAGFALLRRRQQV